MNRRFVFWAGVLISNLVVSGLCLRYLAVRGVSPGDSLWTRGVCCLILVFAFAAKERLTLRPRLPHKQVVRALIAGLALTFFTMSYNWLTASAVSVLSNIDVPLLVVLGPLVGVSASRRLRLLALFSISFLIWYVSGLEAHIHLLYGLASLTVGMILLCFGYWFIKKSMTEENEAVTILVPSLAIIFYGLLQARSVDLEWTAWLVGAALASGATMFGAYYATMRLYERADIALAEFPTLVAALVIQPFEWLFLGVAMQLSYILSTMGFVVAIGVLLRWQYQENAHA